MIGFSLGFGLVLATLGLIGGFTALAVWLDPPKFDFMVGAGTGLLMLVAVAIILIIGIWTTL